MQKKKIRKKKRGRASKILIVLIIAIVILIVLIIVIVRLIVLIIVIVTFDATELFTMPTADWKLPLPPHSSPSSTISAGKSAINQGGG